MIKKFDDLLTSVDVLNTLHGGVTEPFVSIYEEDDGRKMRIRVPGVNREALHVEIHNHALSVFYFIPVESTGKVLNIPQVIYNQAIPHIIETDAIHASFHGNELLITLPFSKGEGNGYNRKIQIEEE